MPDELSASVALQRSPFAGHEPGERPNATGEMGVRLFAETLASVTQVSTWISGVAGLEHGLVGVLGQRAPAASGDTLRTPQGLVFRTGPEEILIVAEGATDNTAWFRRHVAADIGSVTDLSHARCRIRIGGDKCRDALGKLFPIDLREAAFPVEQARLTGHHHVPCLIHRLGADRFDIYVYSTYAHDQLSTVIDAALEYGVVLLPQWDMGTA
ncbi:MAG: hypothetical protein ABIN37_03575 [Burkholderiaceae bacterium]